MLGLTLAPENTCIIQVHRPLPPVVISCHAFENGQARHAQGASFRVKCCLPALIVRVIVLIRKPHCWSISGQALAFCQHISCVGLGAHHIHCNVVHIARLSSSNLSVMFLINMGHRGQQLWLQAPSSDFCNLGAWCKGFNLLCTYMCLFCCIAHRTMEMSKFWSHDTQCYIAA